MPGARVLVIDDREDERIAIASMLREAGYLVEAVGGSRAIEAVERHSPELILLEMGMQNMDGWTIVERLRTMEDVPPIVLLSERGESARRGPLRSCVVAFLVRPIRTADLLGVCERVLGLLARAEIFSVERRHEPRRRLVARIEMPLYGSRSAMSGFLVDYSRRGCQIESIEPGLKPTPGDPIRVHVEVFGETLTLDGRVKWRRVTPRGVVVGVERSILNDTSEHQIFEYLRGN
ncbi:MAG: response regulator [Vicinamibacteria bacterium]|nr:response regulator [Vicinamibacteria bacterium]